MHSRSKCPQLEHKQDGFHYRVGVKFASCACVVLIPELQIVIHLCSAFRHPELVGNSLRLHIPPFDLCDKMKWQMLVGT